MYIYINGSVRYKPSLYYTNMQTIDDFASVLINTIMVTTGEIGQPIQINKGDIPHILTALISAVERFDLLGMSKKKIVLHALDKMGVYIKEEDIEDFKALVLLADTLIDDIIKLTKSKAFQKAKKSCIKWCR